MTEDMITTARITAMLSPVLYSKPKCKPWDLVKGRRMRCCHAQKKHFWWCWENLKGKTITIPKYGSIPAEGL